MKINSIIDLVKDLDTSRQTKNLNKLLIRILLHLQVEFSQNSSNEVAIIEILGIDGRALAQYRVAASQNMNFDVNEGVYLVKVTIGNKQAVSKIIVGM